MAWLERVQCSLSLFVLDMIWLRDAAVGMRLFSSVQFSSVQFSSDQFRSVQISSDQFSSDQFSSDQISSEAAVGMRA
jgi:hypothetical protein